MCLHLSGCLSPHFGYDPVRMRRPVSTGPLNASPQSSWHTINWAAHSGPFQSIVGQLDTGHAYPAHFTDRNLARTGATIKWRSTTCEVARFTSSVNMARYTLMYTVADIRHYISKVQHLVTKMQYFNQPHLPNFVPHIKNKTRLYIAPQVPCCAVVPTITNIMGS